MDNILTQLEATGNDYFSSKDIPISLLKRGVITDKWFTYIIELASKFGNGKSMSEVFLHLHQKVERAFNWCKPSMTPNYILNFAGNETLDKDIYIHIPCGKVVFSKSPTEEGRLYLYHIQLAQGDVYKDTYSSFGLNLTIHSFISSEHKQYLTGDFIENECE